VTVDRRHTAFRVWAPTAQQAAVCLYDSGDGRASAVSQMQFDPDTGTWKAESAGDLSGRYYKYAVDVVVDGVGVVRNLVTDPYSVSLTTDSRRSYVANLQCARAQAQGLGQHAGAGYRQGADGHGGVRTACA
jgi:1,4-alpha-glucan branching enzyme